MFYLLNFWCSTLHSVKSAQHCLYNSGKGRCIRYMWSDDMFVLWNRISAIFMKIENTVYTSLQNSTLLFINELIFEIMNMQNNQSLEFQWIPMLPPLRSVNDQRFSWLRNVFLKSFQFCSAMPRQLYKRCWSENVHIVANIWKIGNKC